MFKHLLVPTDGTEFSLAAVQRAVSFASDAGARITFLHVEHAFPPMYFGEGAIMDENAPATFHEQADSQANQILGKAGDIARDANVEHSTLALICESPYEAIVEAAGRNACDLIFMASHGRSGIGRLLISSETEKVLSHTKIPVLVHR
jgi:nucleotide-binding universal stress UspA family protein